MNAITHAPDRLRFPSPMRMLLVACGLSALVATIVIHNIARQRLAAISYVNKSAVYSDIEFEPNSWWPSALPQPEWVQSVKRVDLFDCECDLRQLTALSELRALRCCRCQIDREGFLRLRALSRLEILELEASTIVDDDLAVVRECPRLSQLDVSSTAVTDAGLAMLAGLPLTELDLRRTGITDDGLTHVAGMKLTVLRLQDTAITDAGVKHAAGLPLEVLGLSRTGVGDGGLAELSKCASLQGLDLTGTGISDNGLQHLARLPLRMLVLSHTRVSDEGLRALAPARFRTLLLEGTDVTPAVVPILATMSALNTVRVSSPPFTEENTRVLSGRSVEVLLY